MKRACTITYTQGNDNTCEFHMTLNKKLLSYEKNIIFLYSA